MIEVFRVAVHLGVVGNATEVLQAVLRHLTGIQGSQRQINANFSRMALLAGGAVTALAGVGVLRGLWGMVKAGKDLNEELLKTQQLTNMTPVQMAQARANDFRVAAATRVVAPSEVERYTRDLITQLGDRPDAQKVVGEAIKAAYVVHNQTGEKQEDVIKNLIKVADIRARIFSVGPDGKEYTDYTKLMPELSAAVNSLIITGGYMSSQKLLMMAQQGGLPAKGMTPEAFYAGLAEMAVSQGAARTGTAITSLFSQLIGGTMTKRTATNMTAAGLLRPEDWTAKGGTGGIVVKPSGTRRFEGFQEDPIAWITGPGKEAINRYAQQQGISQVAAVFQIFGRQTTQRLVGEALQAGPQFARVREFFRTVADLQTEFNRLAGASVNFGITDVEKAWKGLMEALTDSPAAVAVLHDIGSALRGLTNAVLDHQDAARYIVEATAIAAVLAIIGGGLTVLRVGLRGLAGPLGLLTGAAGAGAAATVLGGLAGAVSRLARLALPAWLFSLGTGPAGEYDPKKSKEFNDKWVKEHPGMPDYPLGPRHGHFDQRGTWVPNTPSDVQSGPGLPPPGARTPPAGAPMAPRQAPPSMAPRQAPPSSTGMQSGDEMHGAVQSPERFAERVGNAVKLALNGVSVNMDGKKVGQLVSDHQADAMSRPPTGGNSPDPRVSPIYSGVGGNWALA